jgi:hypothetical protein
VWAYVETPRQLLALRDGRRWVNRYSGYQRAGFDALAATLDAFPSRAGLTAARALGVRDIVLCTTLVGADLSPSTVGRPRPTASASTPMPRRKR